MKLTCDRERLSAAFQTAAAVAPARSPKQILRNVKFDVSEGQGVLSATDLEIGVRAVVVNLDVQAPGSAVLPVARFGAILRESSDAQLRIEADGQGVIVRGERSEFRLLSENPAEFPNVAEFGEKKYYELAAQGLRELIRRTIFATDNESSRYALGGVLFEFGDGKILGVSTDGRRLAKMEIPAKAIGSPAAGDGMTIVPSKALQLIERSLGDQDGTVQLSARGNDILVNSPRVMVYARLLEGRFPRWRDVFPNRPGTSRIEMAVGPFFSAVRQAAIITSDESRGIDFGFDAGTLTLKGRTADAGQAQVELPVAYDGLAITITLDPRYLMDFLRVLDLDKTFTLELKDGDSAAVAVTDDGYGYVIMPLARERQP